MKKEIKKKKNVLIYLLLIISLLGIYSIYIEPYILEIKEYKIENNLIPKSFDSVKIVHFSDIHYGTTVDLEYLNKIVELINKQNPDIVVFTGDFIDKDTKLSEKEIANIRESLNKINSKIGNYAVNGNHDIKHLTKFEKIMDGIFTVLNNEEHLIYHNDTTPISLIGLSDALETEVNYEILKKEDNYYRIILAHEPDEFNKIKDNNFNILLSGHSHNGQVRLPFIGAIYTPVGSKTYFDEYYKINNKEIFISNGIGTSGINIRFLSKPSINLYRLYAQ
ncbi:MAG: metallophosphoesterase [Bacilli bacterium]|nr:metallophosphoesterase [Bacilli bacterium]